MASVIVEGILYRGKLTRAQWSRGKKSTKEVDVCAQENSRGSSTLALQSAIPGLEFQLGCTAILRPWAMKLPGPIC